MDREFPGWRALFVLNMDTVVLTRLGILPMFTGIASFRSSPVERIFGRLKLQTIPIR